MTELLSDLDPPGVISENAREYVWVGASESTQREYLRPHIGYACLLACLRIHSLNTHSVSLVRVYPYGRSIPYNSPCAPVERVHHAVGLRRCGYAVCDWEDTLNVLTPEHFLSGRYRRWWDFPSSHGLSGLLYAALWLESCKDTRRVCTTPGIRCWCRHPVRGWLTPPARRTLRKCRGQPGMGGSCQSP